MKITKSKQDLYWHFVRHYIWMLQDLPICSKDDYIRSRLQDIENYIDNEFLALSDDGDITDSYVVVEQEKETSCTSCTKYECLYNKAEEAGR